MLRICFSLIAIAAALPVFIFFNNEGQDAAMGVAIVGMFTVGASLFVGAPLVIWFFIKRWFKLWQAALAGAAVGLVSSAPFWFTGSSGATMRFLVIFTLLGCGHGAAFWLLAFWKNASLPVAQANAQEESPHGSGAA